MSIEGTLFGAIVYDKDARLAWKIGDITNEQATINQIRGLQQVDVGNNLLKALELARDGSFSFANGARRGASRTLIAFIDKTEVNDRRTEAVAKQLKDAGVKIVLVAIGPKVDKKDIAGVASKPALLFETDDLAKADDLLQNVAEAVKYGSFSNLQAII